MIVTGSPIFLAAKAAVVISFFFFTSQILFFEHSDYTTQIFGHRLQNDTENVKPYGHSACLPPFEPTLVTNASVLRSSCNKTAPFPISDGGIRIGVATAHFGNPQIHYQQALQLHHLHSLIHGTTLHVMCDAVVDEMWNKQAFLLSLIMEEMLKPPAERLEWIFWSDGDTLILDQCRPLSSFLPPSRNETCDADNEHEQDPQEAPISPSLLIAQDWNGLNAGVFMIRVNTWSITFLMAVLSFRTYKPDVPLPWSEQSAMEILLRDEPIFAEKVEYVPKEWFNTYTRGLDEGEAKDYEERDNEEGLDTWMARRGDFLIHFAGLPGKEEHMLRWMETVGMMGNIWDDGRRGVMRDLDGSIGEFWRERGY